MSGLSVRNKLSTSVKKAWRWFRGLKKGWQIAIVAAIIVLAVGASSDTTPQAQQAANKTNTTQSAAEKQAKQAEADQKAQAEAAAKAAQEQHDKNTFLESDKAALKEMSKSGVTSGLKAPSTAKFPGGVIDPFDQWSFQFPKDNVAIVTSYVDSENSFGAMLRTGFQITYCKSDGNINAMSSQFDNQDKVTYSTNCTL